MKKDVIKVLNQQNLEWATEYAKLQRRMKRLKKRIQKGKATK